MTIEIIKPITTEAFKKAEELHSNMQVIEDKINNRINYILETIFNLFDNKLEWWCFPGAEEGEMGNLWFHYDEADGINVESEVRYGTSCKEMVFIDKYGDESEFSGYIPTRWLFEDFEEELKSGKLLFEEKTKSKEEQKIKQKELSAKKKLENKSLIESAKKKLTKKELQAIMRA